MLTQTAVAGAPNVDRQFNVTRKSETAGGVQLGVALGFERNAEIYAEGEDSGYVYKIVSGVVRGCARQLPEFSNPLRVLLVDHELKPLNLGELLGQVADRDNRRPEHERGVGERLEVLDSVVALPSVLLAHTLDRLSVL